MFKADDFLLPQCWNVLYCTDDNDFIYDTLSIFHFTQGHEYVCYFNVIDVDAYL